MQHQFDYIVILQVTTPLRNQEDIDGAIFKLIDTRADSVISVRLVTDFHPWKIKRIIDDRLIPFWEGAPETVRRQDMPDVYIANGGIYAATRHVVMDLNSLYGHDCRPFLMPDERSINIDNEIDLAYAEFLLHWQDKEGRK